MVACEPYHLWCIFSFWLFIFISPSCLFFFLFSKFSVLFAKIICLGCQYGPFLPLACPLVPGAWLSKSKLFAAGSCLTARGSLFRAGLQVPTSPKLVWQTAALRPHSASLLECSLPIASCTVHDCFSWPQRWPLRNNGDRKDLWPAKPQILTIWSFTRKVCRPLS